MRFLSPRSFMSHPRPSRCVRDLFLVVRLDSASTCPFRGSPRQSLEMPSFFPPHWPRSPAIVHVLHRTPSLDLRGSLRNASSSAVCSSLDEFLLVLLSWISNGRSTLSTHLFPLQRTLPFPLLPPPLSCPWFSSHACPLRPPFPHLRLSVHPPTSLAVPIPRLPHADASGVSSPPPPPLFLLSLHDVAVPPFGVRAPPPLFSFLFPFANPHGSRRYCHARVRCAVWNTVLFWDLFGRARPARCLRSACLCGKPPPPPRTLGGSGLPLEGNDPCNQMHTQTRVHLHEARQWAWRGERTGIDSGTATDEVGGRETGRKTRRAPRNATLARPAASPCPSVTLPPAARRPRARARAAHCPRPGDRGVRSVSFRSAVTSGPSDREQFLARELWSRAISL